MVAPSKGGTFSFTMKDGKLQSYVPRWNAKKTNSYSATEIDADGTSVTHRNFWNKNAAIQWQEVGKK